MMVMTYASSDFLQNSAASRAVQAVASQLKRRRSTSPGLALTPSHDHLNKQRCPQKRKRTHERVSYLSRPTNIDLSVPDALGSDEAITPEAFSQALENVLTESATKGPTNFCGRLDHSSLCRTNDWWFSDGDIIIGVESLLFRVHKRVLAMHSTVFADMFALSEASDKVENIDSVQLHDSAEEWLETLDWIYNRKPSYAKDEDLVPFATIRRHLTISNKYDMGDLRDHALKGFERLYPGDCISIMHSRSPLQQLATFQDSAEALVLARRCNAESVLPSIFYCLSTGRHGEDGKYHPDIDPCDIRSLKAGKEKLDQVREALAAGPIVPMELMPQDTFTNYPDVINSATLNGPFCEMGCGVVIQKIWQKTFDSSDPGYWYGPLLQKLDDLSEVVTHMDSICQPCGSLQWYRSRMYKTLICSSVPEWFGLR